MTDKNECIICLDEINNNNNNNILEPSYIIFPVKNNKCTCKFFVHYDCLMKYDYNCPICNIKIKSITFDDINGNNKYQEVYKLLIEKQNKEIINSENLDNYNNLNNNTQLSILDENPNSNRCYNFSKVCCITVSTLLIILFFIGFLCYMIFKR
tara:strand:- start:308 stop:766 length:459 start_codon:yes stop_codon:yes gene_type:complete